MRHELAKLFRKYQIYQNSGAFYVQMHNEASSSKKQSLCSIASLRKMAALPATRAVAHDFQEFRPGFRVARAGVASLDIERVG